MLRLMCVVCVAALAACSQPAPTAETPPAPAPAALSLEPLAATDTAGRLGGELGCSFRVGEEQLLLAMGIVASQTPSEAVVKHNGAASVLQATAPGGFDTLSDGETFAGGGLTVEVATSSDIATGTEEVQHNATLTVRDAGGATQAYQGVWTCGP